MQRFNGKFYPSGRRTEEENDKESYLKNNYQRDKDYTMLEVFNIQFKNSIRYGMTYSQFWFDDPQLYYIYEEAYIDEQKDRLKEKDILNWQLGQYIQVAICASFDDKGRCKYPQSPMFYYKNELEVDRPKSAKEMKDYFRNRIKPMFNKNF